ncbi:MAG TPA: EamA family transporter [Patescibacteria group bacterium]|nr:EamA family transporter [Patescibacteria group bacterium]
MGISYLLVGLSGYFLLAFSSVADKFLVSKVVRAPVAYAFYTAVTGPFSLLLLPFGGKILNLPDMLVALSAGIAFIIGIYFSWSAIGKASVSRVVPIQAGLGPLFTFILSYFILSERLGILQSFGFVLLVFGAVLISFRRSSSGWAPSSLWYASLSALFFALTSVLTKYTFNHSNYITGLVWPSVGFVIPLAFILPFKSNRKAIFNAPKEAGKKNVALYYSSRATGTIGGYLQKYAVKLGSVTVVNALQGMQFVFLLILTTFLSIYYPKVLKERINTETVILKASAIAAISIGLFLLTK